MSKNQIHPLLVSQEPVVIAAIGNDHISYTHTYHNIGFLCLDYILEVHKEEIQKKNIPSKSTFSAWERLDNTIFVKNNTFINVSGEPIKRSLSFFSIPPSRLIVIHDDSDIALGEYKISFERNDAGHNGVSSIINSLKTNSFYRIRIGIRPDDIPQKKALDFVLSPISQRHKEIFNNVFVDIDTLLSRKNLA